MTAADRSDIIGHFLMFGETSVVRKLGRKWTVQFRGFGYPGVFNTKNEAIQWAREWRRALAA